MSARPPQQTRPSQRRFLARRIGVLVVLGALAFGVVRVVSGLVADGDSADADASSATQPEAGAAEADAGVADADAGVDGAGDAGGDAGADDGADGEANGVAAVSTASDADGSTTAPVASDPESVDDTGPPSSTNPATVYVVGDSDAGTFGPYLERLLDGTNLTETELNYKVSSGLARPDFFDWPSELAAKIPEVDPDIVVATFGGNDANILRDAAGNDLAGYPESDPEAWTEIYQSRVEEVMDILGADDRAVIWVGIPNDDNPDVTARLAVQDEAVRAAAAERPNVIFIDTWSRFSGRDGNWAEFVIDPRDGQGKDVRAEDGFHLNVDGAEILALDIAQAVRDALRELGASI